jgi:hypothetical protein
MSDEAFDVEVPGGSAANGHAAGGDDDHLKRFLDETLESVLRSAQDSAAQMMERAREASLAEASLARQMREQAQRETDRMTAWRAEVEPLVDAVNTKAAAIRECIGEVPTRVADALAPITDALSDVDSVLERLTSVLASRDGGSGGGPDGPNAPGGPSGGGGLHVTDDAPAPAADDAWAETSVVASSYGTLGEVMGSADLPPHDGTTDEPAYEQDADPVAPAVPAAPVALHAVAEQPVDEDADWGEPAHDNAVAEAGADTAFEAQSGPSRWVDWPGDEVPATAGSDAPQSEASSEWREDADAHDEDDAALRSATTQLRRAVTDIDWHDLPSASNG